MAINLNNDPSNCHIYRVNETKNSVSRPLDTEQKKDILSKLLANPNLMMTSFLKELPDPADQEKLIQHIRKNKENALENINLRVSCDGKRRTIKQFKTVCLFEDDIFRNADYIMLFLSPNEGTTISEQQLENLKYSLTVDLLGSKRLTEYRVFHSGFTHHSSSFFDETQERLLNNKININNEYLSQYKTNWPFWTGLTLGLLGLVTVILPEVGLFYGLLCSAMLFGIGINAGSLFSTLREKALHYAGSKYLKALKADKVPEDKSLQESIRLGYEAREWKPYLKSFLNLKTYHPTNYQGFAAGLYTGENRLAKESKTIKRKLKP